MKKSFEQFARIKRWKNRLEDLEDGERTDSPRYYEDILFVIFENCWHLKDWLIKSKELDKKIVEEFFHNNPYMKLCHSLAIGSKHLQPYDHVKKIRLFRESKANGYLSFKVLTEDGKVEDAFNLAKRCVKECGDFLLKNGLI